LQADPEDPALRAVEGKIREPLCVNLLESVDDPQGVIEQMAVF